MKNNLTSEQMAMALYLLCSDVVLLRVNCESFYYFKPREKSNALAVQYVLRQNGVPSNRHRSHYYDTSFGSTSLVVRVSKNDFQRYAKNEFRLVFEQMYSNRDFYLQRSGLKNTVDNLFWLKTKSGKEKVLERMLERNR